MTTEERHCDSRGRRIEWRRKWADDRDSVRWCSATRRRRKVRPVDRALEAVILEFLDGRAQTATICLSEAAARRLVVAGRVEICQSGRVVDASTAGGPIRIRRRT